MPCLQLVPWGWGSSDSSLSELCPYIYLISGNCTKHAANILLSKYLHRKETLELTRYKVHLNQRRYCGHITCQPMQEFFLHLDLSVHGLVLPALLQTGLTLLSPGTRPQCPRSLLLPTSPFASSTSLGSDHSVHGLVLPALLQTGLTLLSPGTRPQCPRSSLDEDSNVLPQGRVENG